MLERSLSPEENALLEKLHKEQYEHLYKTAVSLLHNPHMANDIVQDTFVYAADHIKEVMDSERPGGWLYKAMTNLIKHAIRTRNMITARNIPLESVHNLSADEKGFEINELDEENDDLQLLKRYYEYGYSMREIGEMYGIKETAAKMRIKRARERLQKDPQIQKLKEFYF